MDISTLERLLPHIAWPLTVLICLPFVISRIDKMAKLYEVVEGNKLSEFLQKLKEVNDGIASLETSINNAEESKLEEAAFKLQEKSQNLPSAILGVDDNLNPEQMLADIRSRWTRLTEAIKEKSSSQVDARSIGTAAFKLTDGRRNFPLTQEDATLIGELHSQFKRFTRLQATVADWMTPEIYSTFVASASRALDAVKRVGTRS
jgi:hypothetical protein